MLIKRWIRGLIRVVHPQNVSVLWTVHFIILVKDDPTNQIYSTMEPTVFLDFVVSDTTLQLLHDPKFATGFGLLCVLLCCLLGFDHSARLLNGDDNPSWVHPTTRCTLSLASSGSAAISLMYRL